MAERLNAVDVILGHAARLAAKPAIFHHPALGEPLGVSYGELAESVNRAANAFTARGLARGDRVCVLMNDSPRFCAAFLGAMKAGGVAVALNTRLSHADYAFILNDSGARFVIADDAFVHIVEAALGANAPLKLMRSSEFDAACAQASPSVSSVATTESVHEAGPVA